MPEVFGRDVTMARRQKPAKFEPVVTSKCTSGRPLLTGTAPQTEFRATHSKQTTEKFLTGARTHISIFNFSPFPTQNSGQLIQLLHALPAHKYVPSAPLLPGSAQNIENDVTYSQQTTEDFLPGATTTSSLSPDNARFTTQNPTQLIQRHRHPGSEALRPALPYHRVMKNRPVGKTDAPIKPVITGTIP